MENEASQVKDEPQPTETSEEEDVPVDEEESADNTVTAWAFLSDTPNQGTEEEEEDLSNLSEEELLKLCGYTPPEKPEEKQAGNGASKAPQSGPARPNDDDFKMPCQWERGQMETEEYLQKVWEKEEVQYQKDCQEQFYRDWELAQKQAKKGGKHKKSTEEADDPAEEDHDIWGSRGGWKNKACCLIDAVVQQDWQEARRLCKWPLASIGIFLVLFAVACLCRTT